MWQIIVVLFVLAFLFAAGLLFVNQSLYKDFEGKDPVAQVDMHTTRHAALNAVQSPLLTIMFICRGCLRQSLHFLQICFCSSSQRSLMC